MSTTILRLRAVISKTGNSGSTTYLRISQGLFPKPVKIGPKSSGWPENEVDAVNAAHIAGMSNDEIRALVAKLEAARKSALCAVGDDWKKEGRSWLASGVLETLEKPPVNQPALPPPRKQQSPPGHRED